MMKNNSTQNLHQKTERKTMKSDVDFETSVDHWKPQKYQPCLYKQVDVQRQHADFPSDS